jgi:molecular chaperone DnaK
MYKASSAAPQGDAGAPPPPPQGEAKKDDVVDAEFVDVDDKGKK